MVALIQPRGSMQRNLMAVIAPAMHLTTLLGGSRSAVRTASS